MSAVQLVRIIAWLIGSVYASIPLFWIVGHNLSPRLRRRPYRILLPFWAAAIAGLALATLRWRDDVLFSSLAAQIVGLILLLCGATIYARSGRGGFSSEQLTGMNEFDTSREQRLITSGMHGRVRHPIYLAHLANLIGWTLLTGSAALIALLGFAILTGAFMLQLEERELVRRFGESYREYQRRVPQVLPRLWRHSAVIAVVAMLAISTSAESLRFLTVPRDIVLSRLKDAPRKDKEREQKLEDLFTAAGCAQENLTEQKVSGQPIPNIICVVPGQERSEIILGAHYDYIHEGSGIVDNWSGASLLPSLVQSVKAVPRKHTYRFIAFSGEEKGLVGSKFYVDHLSADDRANIKAMVNIDTLGLAPTEVWSTHADKTLLHDLAVIAYSTKLPISQMNVDNVGSADSESFRDKKVPALTLHSVTNDTLRILHSPRDQFDAIKPDDYYDSYKLIAAFAVYLDDAVDAPSPAK